MSPDSLVFSHQREAVISLAPLFDSITVFTFEMSPYPLPKNVRTIEIFRDGNSRLLNFFRIIQITFPFIIRNRKSILFNHMTDVHAAILAPLAMLLRMRHVLWYAHAHNSIYLIWSSFFLSCIVSSTPGSCNLKVNRRKIVFINQGIRPTDFPFKVRTLNKSNRLFYYGRLDRSKNIHLFNELIVALNQITKSYTLDIFGKPTSLESGSYLRNLESSIRLNPAIRLHGAIERKAIPETSEAFGVFINLFTGSLDKTLIENTLMGLPVVTWNQEYCAEFGTWSGVKSSESIDFIIHEISFLNSVDHDVIHEEISRRLRIAEKNHSFDSWIEKLVLSLKEGKKG
jgi:glycosyltransferase involved in cell wall biosynthesis